MPPQLLRRATLADGSITDVRLLDDSIAEVGDLVAGPEDHVVELEGHMLLPAGVEPHAHLDKAFLADMVQNETGDLYGAIEAMRQARPLFNVPETVARATRAARLLAANGITTVRTHADTTVDHGLTSIEALAKVREEVADLIDIEIVALCGWPVTGTIGAPQRELLRTALAAGADAVGGCPHLDEAGTRASTEVFLEIAGEAGVPIDLHTDETLQADVLGLAELAELVLASGFDQRVTASHCVSLSMQDEQRQRDVADTVAAAGISVVALPATNLYLQGREHQQAMPRGVTAVSALLAAGVNVCAGADNLQDPFNPYGRACPFETAALTTLTTHVSPAMAWSMVTDNARIALGRPPVAIAPGHPAELVAVPGSSLRQVIAFGPPDRKVWHRGRRIH